MAKVGNLEKIIEAFGPHFHDAPYGGWRADRVIDKVVPLIALTALCSVE